MPPNVRPAIVLRAQPSRDRKGVVLPGPAARKSTTIQHLPEETPHAA